MIMVSSMTRWPLPWRILGYTLISLAVLAWVGAGASLAAGLGPPTSSNALIAAAVLAAAGLVLIMAAIGLSVFLVRSRRMARSPVDTERRAAIRQSLKWVWLSYLPLAAGIAWWVFAVNEWAGQRGFLLGVSGFMFGLAGGAAIYSRFMSVVAPRRRLVGMSFGTYTLVMAAVTLVSAIVLAVLAFASPQP
jgi:hypothetical protein